MRTDEEIVARIKEVQESESDFFGAEQSDLLARLPFAAAKQFLADTFAEEGWAAIHAPRDREHLINEMREYMPFAWEKANEFRGLSAGRSLSHFRAWVWLAGDDLGEFNNYQHYGKDHLVRICNHYGFENLDDGVRKNSEEA